MNKKKVGADDFIAAGATARDLGALPRIEVGEEAPHLTDAGNAQRFARQHGGRVHYVHPQHRWLCWTGTRWEPDAEGGAVARAKQTGRSVYEEAARAEDPDRRKALARWAAYSESEPACRRMLALAQSEPGIPVLPDALDREPYVLNTLTGIVNLRDGRLGPHDPARLLTKLAPVRYDPAAACPQFLAFLERIFDGRKPLIDFVRRAVGYAAGGDPRGQVLFMLHGSGANGKSTLMTVIRRLLGDYAVSTAPETLLVKRDGGIPNDIARLHGARLVSAVEVEGGKRLAESLVKAMTGGDILVARFLHQEFFEFLPTFTLFVAVNRRPRIVGTDHAIWRRIKLIPFDVVIPEPEQDRQLADRLVAEEGAGIFRWIVEGHSAWRRDGLGEPEAVRAATAAYRREQDTLGDFLRACCVLEPQGWVSRAELRGALEQWGASEGFRKLPDGRAVAEALRERGCQEDRRSRGGERGWLGVRLRTADDPDPADGRPSATPEAVIPW